MLFLLVWCFLFWDLDGDGEEESEENSHSVWQLEFSLLFWGIFEGLFIFPRLDGSILLLTIDRRSHISLNAKRGYLILSLVSCPQGSHVYAEYSLASFQSPIIAFLCPRLSF